MESIFESSTLGLERGVVKIAPSDPEWPVTFHQLAARTLPELPETVVAIEHIGSTAVPGLPAKPILDIAIGIRPGSDPSSPTTALENLGFIYRGDFEGEQFNRVFGLEYQPKVRLVNVHMVIYDDGEWRHYVGFRDRLRADPTVRDEYARVKQRLATTFPADRNSYITGKNHVVADTLQSRESNTSHA